MANYESISEIIKELHKINFGKENGIIKIADDYDFDKYRETEFKHKGIKKYCEDCQGKCLIEKDDKYKKDDKFKLCNMSHGTHTFDFLEACGQNPKEVINNAEWTDTPVLFLMENPSRDYDIYDYINEKKDGKRPAKKWYWIHSDWSKDYENKKFGDDTYFKQGIYGRMVFALIKQFKLANAYLTNAVKCGMSDAEYDPNPTKENNVNESKALNLSRYNFECIEKCFSNKLANEINALIGNKNELIIFAFGSRTYWYIKDFMASEDKIEWHQKKKNYKIILMPHPADRINNDFRKYILKYKIKEALETDSETPLSRCCLSEEDEEDIKIMLEDALKNEDNKDIKVDSQRGIDRYSFNIIKNHSEFLDQDYLKTIRLRNPKQSTNDEVKDLGYNFEDDSYWAYNKSKKEDIEPSELPYYECFKNVIEYIKKNHKVENKE